MKDKLTTGSSFEDKIVFQKEDVETFARITEDTNPLHLDKEYALNTPYKKMVVHGMLAASRTGTLGKFLSKAGSVLVQREVTFIRPLFVDETCTVVSRVVEVNRADKTIAFKSWLKNPQGKTCIKMYSQLKNPILFD